MRILTSLLSLALFLTLPTWAQTTSSTAPQTETLDQNTEFARRASALPGVRDIQRIATTKYPEKYVLKIEHPVDYDNPDTKDIHFTQRVFVGHVGFDRPTVLITEGYGGGREMSPGAAEEISQLLNANMIFVEYRFFQESMPDSVNYDWLTVRNSLLDLHDIVTQFKQLYTRKWLATGISKGGQTCMFYRAYFPDDVDVSVPYVAPLNKSVEDGRHQPFLTSHVGNAAERQAVLDFQTEVLKRRDRMEPLLQQFCQEKNYHYNTGVTMSELLDMMVLEYSYALWQWGTNVHTIPNLRSSDKVLFDHLVSTSGPEYFQPYTEYLSFFIQAAKELGYYGYDTKPLRKYLSIKNSNSYLRRLMLPEQLQDLKFDKSLYRHTVDFLKHNDPKMIYIYGENDPWSASGVLTWLDFSKKQNMHLYVDPNGSHRARIATLPATQREECISLLKEWMEVE